MCRRMRSLKGFASGGIVILGSDYRAVAAEYFLCLVGNVGRGMKRGKVAVDWAKTRDIWNSVDAIER